MQRAFLILISTFLLSACAITETEKPVCTGNYLRNCQPVIYFATNSSHINKKGHDNLDWVEKKLSRFPERNVRIVGYADSSGRHDKNKILSQKRAVAVKNYLLNKGIDEKRIETSFVGDTLSTCQEKSCQHLDRRAEVNVHTVPVTKRPFVWNSTKQNKTKKLSKED